MTMPSELTRGIPRPPKTAPETSMQKKRKRREREGLVVVLRAMLTSWLTKPTADSPTPSLDRDAAGTVSPYHKRFERPIRSDSGFYQRRTRRILFSPRSQM